MSKKIDKKLKKQVKFKILNLLKDNQQKSFSEKQIAKKIGFHQPMKRKMVAKFVLELLDEEKLAFQNGGFTINSEYNDPSNQANEGAIEFTKNGSAYILVEDGDDIYVHRGNSLNALNADIVSYKLDDNSRKRKPEAKVIEVIKRNKKQFVGTIEISKKFAFVIPNNRKIHVDFFIDLKNLKGAKDGDKVIVEMINWPTKISSPFGRISKILGKAGETDTEINAIMEDFELPYEFPERIIKEAQNISTEITKEEISKRRDLRNITTLTIDPFDAKDFDDAISIQSLENGNYEIGVHIADVSHYVKENSLVDQEAKVRGTSVYLVDRVVPMLPEILSNQLCSLRPNEEKLAFSAIFELSPEAELKNSWYGRTVINSNRRFTYEEAQERIEGLDGDYKEEINTLNNLAQIMRKARMENGALNIESTEVKFIVENGKPTGVKLKQSKEAHKLVEEFMLLANKNVAKYVGDTKPGQIKYPLMYRVHDNPSPDRLADLHLFVNDLGYTIKEVKGKPISYALNNLLIEAKENDEINFVGPMVIRSMAKAVYTTQNIGHYGLGFDHYVHFTSPIRRYPDIEVHRVLQNFLDKTSPISSDSEMEDRAKYFSGQEKKATEAERASIKFMQVVYMADKIGEEFNGIISGVATYGIFVELEDNKCEGLIKTHNIKQDQFIFEADTKKMVGKRFGDELKMGTNVRVRIARIDMLNRTIDFELVDIY